MAVVEQLIADVGLRPIRVGDVDATEVVDGVGRLWLTLVFRAGYPRQTHRSKAGGYSQGQAEAMHVSTLSLQRRHEYAVLRVDPRRPTRIASP